MSGNRIPLSGSLGYSERSKRTLLKVAPTDHFQVIVKGNSKTNMIKNPRIRRASAAIMILLGAILMLLAAEPWPGALLFVSGIVLELAGIALERKAK